MSTRTTKSKSQETSKEMKSFLLHMPKRLGNMLLTYQPLGYYCLQVAEYSLLLLRLRNKNVPQPSLDKFEAILTKIQRWNVCD
jgi:hypothetical protein